MYSFSDHLLFVLLRTNHVLVCDAHFNPCLTKEIWIASASQYKINILAMVMTYGVITHDPIIIC